MTASRRHERTSPGAAAQAQTGTILTELPAVLTEMGINPDIVEIQVEEPTQIDYE